MASSNISKNHTVLKTQKLFLPQSQTIDGTFDIVLNASLSGYYPIGVIGFTLNDRGLGDKLFFTSMHIIDDSKLRLMGKSTESVTLNANACFYVLYQKR